MVMQNMGMGACIPVIDMKDFSRQNEKLMEACRDWGCFRIVNHSIPESLMMDMKAVSRSLLDLPLEVKLRNSHPVQGKGYTPRNRASPVFEGLGCYDMAAPGALDNFFDQLWCYSSAKGDHIKILKSYTRAWHGHGKEVAYWLGSIWESILMDGLVKLRINKYNYTPEYVGSTGAVLHTVPGFLTILQDDAIIGDLEAVHKETGEYIPVDPMPGSLVVNLGDLAQIWSNGRLWSVKHRVQCYEGRVRLSIAMFVLGPKDGALGAPEELVDSEHPRLYNPMNFEDYRMLRITTRSPTGAIELLRIKS
ncbi:2-oxoglutarate (2OG) and Fe(II)-dependent oxygenase superfamily protein [Actinidia rufa]|uniref:2-oxoglutarate (2OG) and Fe(II)-dependent oxygenase superfamily protein n=1 Tax=Actinidia rufa TaxID=165716 RepID=A0A7J0F4T5_9ERIC|nr:2-oxoglutarate (2OG) and Fe(II)-dependent oxygenase superfamily protein [Actinidia rufa]